MPTASRILRPIDRGTKKDYETYTVRRHDFELRGTRLSFYYRGDTNDFDTIQSILEDEYGVLDMGVDGGLCVDIGAHIGGMTILAGKHLGMTVHSYEPCKENVDLLQKNVLLNCVDAKIFHLAISNHKQVEMGYTDELRHRHITNTESCKDRFWVRGIHLRDILSCSPIDLLKIDAEGAEHLFASVPKNQLSNVKYIVGEYHPTPSTNFTQFLSIFRMTHSILETKSLNIFRLKRKNEI